MEEKDKERLLQGFPQKIRENADVTMSYQAYLRAINKHLISIYGECANWTRCVNGYFKSDFYNQNCHYVKNCEEIPVLSRDDIDNMLKQEEEYSTSVTELLSLREMLSNTNKDTIYSIASLLGIHPDIKDNSIYKWILNRDYLNSIQYNQVKNSFDSNLQLVSLIGEVLSDMFHNGLLLEFPYVGIAMTQQKGQYYYRGENAFYNSSKPGIYRQNADRKKTKWIHELVYVLRQYECWNLLEQFDAVKYWELSSVNYLALSQHYGLKTKMMDVTSDLKTALFFACCKWGNDKKWHPLTNDEIKEINSRKYVSGLGGDSRYGIIYRCPTEINDMKWALCDEKTGFNIITPIGYQPFMRCSQQHGYMLIADSEEYDMMKDPLFDKFKVRLDEDLCMWIYEEMNKGNAIYPNSDIPNIEEYITYINNQNYFSEKIFQTVVEEAKLNYNSEEKLRKILKGYGYYIIPNISYLSNEELDIINRKYNVNTAYSKNGAKSVARPIYTFSSDMLV